MPTTDDDGRKRKNYEKPKITVIDLAADEVLATGCKTPTGSGNPGIPVCVGGGCALGGS